LFNGIDEAKAKAMAQDKKRLKEAEKAEKDAENAIKAEEKQAALALAAAAGR